MSAAVAALLTKVEQWRPQRRQQAHFQKQDVPLEAEERLARLLHGHVRQPVKGEEEEKNVKAAVEIAAAATAPAPASTLGDANDILAGLKAKMEKNEKKK